MNHSLFTLTICYSPRHQQSLSKDWQGTLSRHAMPGQLQRNAAFGEGFRQRASKRCDVFWRLLERSLSRETMGK